MRVISTFILGLVALVLVVVLAIFALQNTSPVPLNFLGYGTTGNIWWIALAAAILGFIVAYLLLLPGRVAAGWHAQDLSRQMARRDEELASVRQQREDAYADRTQLQQQYQQLQAQHDQLAHERPGLVSERNQLAAERDRLVAERSQPSQQPAAATIPGTAAAPYVETQPAPASERPDVPREREDVVMGQRPDSERSQEATEHADTTEGEQPSLADRVRGFFRGPSEPSEPSEPSAPDETSDGTTQPDGAYPREDRPVGPPA